MGKSSAPAPDYASAAKETAAGNMANLQWQTQANRPTVQTPWGSQTWTQDKNNNWTQTIALSPDQQAALDAQQKIQNEQSQLAGSLRNQVSETMQDGFTAPSLSSYTKGLEKIDASFDGFKTNTPGVNYDAKGAVAGAGKVNLNAPQFNQATADAGSRAAYAAQTGLLKDQWSQDNKGLDEKLRLQGLQPGTEAYNNAMQNQSRVQAQQQDQIANQSVLTGNEMANQNYASALQGYGAQNVAQNQAFTQGAQTFDAGNQAIAQGYGQALSGYGANTQAQQLSNQGASASYGLAKDQYQTNYQAALQQYLQPLNNMNAVLTGQQVQSPTFQNSPNSTAGYVPGADYSSAANMYGQYMSGQTAANNASASSTTGAIGTAAVAAMMMY